MTITTQALHEMKNIKNKSGFSLVEVMVSMTIATFILASSYATLISLSKGTESMVNFSEMNAQTRNALELFGRDSRMASAVIHAREDSFRLVREMEGNQIEVRYRYVPNSKIFERIQFDNAGNVTERRTILYDVDELFFNYYTARQNQTNGTGLADIKHVQLEAKLERNVLNITNTNYIISARFMMRNKHVAN
jgi:prepilin-type N-terminal cleavage/methylation domain-containing protein